MAYCQHPKLPSLAASTRRCRHKILVFAGSLPIITTALGFHATLCEYIATFSTFFFLVQYISFNSRWRSAAAFLNCACGRLDLRLICEQNSLTSSDALKPSRQLSTFAPVFQISPTTSRYVRLPNGHLVNLKPGWVSNSPVERQTRICW